MSMTDPIADLASRIRNAQTSNLRSIVCPYSKLKFSILTVLKREGYIVDFYISDDSVKIKDIVIILKYYNSQPVINKIVRQSKPGRRLFSAIGELNRYYNGLGIYILSTSQGVISDYEAREKNIGGEILLSVY